jgi:hypothetical protein
MKTIKGTITTLLIIFCYSFSEAQQVSVTPAQMIEEHKKEISNTAFIFEGIVIQQKQYNGKKQLVTTCIIQITKIFKGSPQLKVGSIKLVTKQRDKSGDLISIPSDEGYMVPISKGSTYIIFARPAGSWAVDSTITDNTITLTSWYGLDYPIIVHNNDAVSWYDTPQFKTKEDVYSFFKENGLTVQEQAADSAKGK